MSDIYTIEPLPAQQFTIGDYQFLMAYNVVGKFWTYSIKLGDVWIKAGRAMTVGVNLMAGTTHNLQLVDTVKCPRFGWYERLTTFIGENPETVLVLYDV